MISQCTLISGLNYSKRDHSYIPSFRSQRRGIEIHSHYSVWLLKSVLSNDMADILMAECWGSGVSDSGFRWVSWRLSGSVFTSLNQEQQRYHLVGFMLEIICSFLRFHFPPFPFCNVAQEADLFYYPLLSNWVQTMESASGRCRCWKRVTWVDCILSLTSHGVTTG